MSEGLGKSGSGKVWKSDYVIQALLDYCKDYLNTSLMNFNRSYNLVTAAHVKKLYCTVNLEALYMYPILN